MHEGSGQRLSKRLAGRLAISMLQPGRSVCHTAAPRHLNLFGTPFRSALQHPPHHTTPHMHPRIHTRPGRRRGTCLRWRCGPTQARRRCRSTWTRRTRAATSVSAASTTPTASGNTCSRWVMGGIGWGGVGWGVEVCWGRLKAGRAAAVGCQAAALQVPACCGCAAARTAASGGLNRADSPFFQPTTDPNHTYPHTGALQLPRLPAALGCVCLLQHGPRPAAAHEVRGATATLPGPAWPCASTTALALPPSRQWHGGIPPTQPCFQCCNPTPHPHHSTHPPHCTALCCASTLTLKPNPKTRTSGRSTTCVRSPSAPTALWLLPL